MNQTLKYIFINAFFWVLVHFASSYLVHFLPDKIYDCKNLLFKTRKIEINGNIYKKFFKINLWKDYLPEAGKFLGLHPFSKKHFISKSNQYIKRFILETCRGELAHILPFLFLPVSFIWNPTFADIITLFYVIIFNIPFIMVQRYNRIRLVNLINKESVVPFSS